jgi:hypothetical protein
MSNIPEQKYLARFVALKESSSKRLCAVVCGMALSDFMSPPEEDTSML